MVEKNNSYLFAIDDMRVLDDFINHRWISISNKPKSTRLSSFPVLHDDRISNLTIFTKVLDKLGCKTQNPAETGKKSIHKATNHHNSNGITTLK